MLSIYEYTTTVNAKNVNFLENLTIKEERIVFVIRVTLGV